MGVNRLFFICFYFPVLFQYGSFYIVRKVLFVHQCAMFVRVPYRFDIAILVYIYNLYTCIIIDTISICQILNFMNLYECIKFSPLYMRHIQTTGWTCGRNFPRRVEDFFYIQR